MRASRWFVLMVLFSPAGPIHGGVLPDPVPAPEWEVADWINADPGALAAPGDDTPITMRRFRTRGTPQIVIVDKQGRLRFSHFGSFEPGPVEGLIERLLAEPPTN